MDVGLGCGRPTALRSQEGPIAQRVSLIPAFQETSWRHLEREQEGRPSPRWPWREVEGTGGGGRQPVPWGGWKDGPRGPHARGHAWERSQLQAPGPPFHTPHPIIYSSKLQGGCYLVYPFPPPPPGN